MANKLLYSLLFPLYGVPQTTPLPHAIAEDLPFNTFISPDIANYSDNFDKFDKAEKIFFYFHGNMQMIHNCKEEISNTIIEKKKTIIITVEYPGYFANDHHLESSRNSIMSIIFRMTDAITAIKMQYHLENKKIIYVGRSVGSLIACQLCRYLPPDELILITPLAGIYPSAFPPRQDLISFIGLTFAYPFIADEHLDNIPIIKELKIPIHIIHAIHDDVIPAENTRLLCAANSHIILHEINETHNSFDLGKCNQFFN